MTLAMTPIASAICIQWGMLIRPQRASFAAYVLAGGPFLNFDRSVR